MSEHQRTPGRLTKWLQRISAGVACVLVGGFYFWTVDPAISQLNTPTPADAYYNLLVQGFRAGHLSLSKQPAPELAQLSDPYDPRLNGPYHVHDVSYYQGRFYLYFGATPALVLFWPCVVLTGHYLFHKHAVAIFCLAGFLVAAGLLRALRRRYFPEVGSGVALAGLLALGLTTGVPIMLRRPDVWEVPIACAHLLLMVTLVLLWRALHAARGAVWWLAAASLVYGLAVGARPSLLFGAVILLFPVVYGMRQPGEAGRPHLTGALARQLAATVVPITLVGLGLLLYNYRRFGDPWQFGQRYQLAWNNESHLQHFGLRFLGFNLRLYFLQPVWWSCYFPFVEGVVVPPAPPGQLGVENPFGVLVNVPFVWLALAVPLAWRGRPAGARAILRWFCGAVGVLGGISALTIGLFAGACGRYEVDFLPALILLAVCGVLGVERTLASHRRWRRLARCGWGGLLAFSVGFNLGASLAFGNRFRTEDPVAFGTLARGADWPVHWIEQRLGVRHGPLEMKVMLPPYTTPRYEPLLVTGFAPQADYLYLHYLDAGHFAVGFEHTDWGGPVSPPIPVDYDQEHTFVIELGSLYPPLEHPWFADPRDAVAAARHSRLRVTLDGREIIAGFTPVYDASNWNRYPGRNPFAEQFGRKFTGRIRAERTLPALDLPELRAVGPVTLQVRFARMSPGQSEPLVVTGVPTRADFLYVRYSDSRHIVLALDHWGGGGPESAPIAVEPDRTYELTAFMGSLYPPACHLAPQDARRRRFEVRFEGRTVLTGDIDFYVAGSDRVYFGWNPVGGSSTGLRFSGNLGVEHRGE